MGGALSSSSSTGAVSRRNNCGGCEVAYMKSVADPDDNESSSIYRNVNCPDGKFVDGLSETKNCYDLFLRGLQISRENTCVGRFNNGEFSWRTYAEFHEIALEIGSGLLHRDAVPCIKFNSCGFHATVPSDCVQHTFRFIGLYSRNREEWAMTEQASNAYGFTLVPLYDTLGEEAFSHICMQTKFKTLISQGDSLTTVLNRVSNTEISLIVSMEAEVDAEMVAAFQTKKVDLIGWNELRRLGKDNGIKPVTPAESHCINTVCYTSGTTGMPKGVMTTHGQYVAAISAALFHLTEVVMVPVEPTDVYLSYLPFAHSFERILFQAMLSCGGSIGFYRGDTTKLVDDIGLLRPTLFASVPRIFSRVYDKIQSAVEAGSGLKKSLFSAAANSKISRLRSTGVLTHPLWDALVFSNTKKVLGGRCRLLVTGSAPINPKVHEFLKIAFAAPFMEGYGLTESCAASTLTLPNDTRVGHIGGAIECCEIKVVSIPEMRYLVTDTLSQQQGADADIIKSKPESYSTISAPRGELCLRGPSVFPGYFMDQEKTDETMDSKGWLHTGDIAQIMPNGCIRIVDRKKNIFKLAQGEYVAPEKVEGVLVQAPLVAQAFVYGNSHESCCIAIIVPDEHEAMNWAKSRGKTFETLPDDKDFNDTLTAQIATVSASNKLSGIEKVKKFRVKTELFSVENDLLTPTFKLKRFQATEKYKAELTVMYQELNDSVVKK